MNKKIIVLTLFMAVFMLSCATTNGLVVAMFSHTVSGAANTPPDVESTPGRRPPSSTVTNVRPTNPTREPRRQTQSGPIYEVELVEAGYILVLDEPVVFRETLSTLTRSNANDINKVIDFLNEYESARVVVEGHPDPSGEVIYNLNLVRSRALNVYEYLLSEGVTANRLLFYDSGTRINNDNVSLANDSVRFIIINDREAYSHYLDYVRKYNNTYPTDNNSGPLPTNLQSPVPISAIEKKSDILTSTYANVGITIVVEDKPEIKENATSVITSTNYAVVKKPKKSIAVNFGIYKDMPYKTHAVKNAVLIVARSADTKKSKNVVNDNADSKKIKIARKTAEIVSQMYYPISTTNKVGAGSAKINAVKNTVLEIAKIENEKKLKLTLNNMNSTSPNTIKPKVMGDEVSKTENISTLKLANPAKEKQKKEMIKVISYNEVNIPFKEMSITSAISKSSYVEVLEKSDELWNYNNNIKSKLETIKDINAPDIFSFNRARISNISYTLSYKYLSGYKHNKSIDKEYNYSALDKNISSVNYLLFNYYTNTLSFYQDKNVSDNEIIILPKQLVYLHNFYWQTIEKRGLASPQSRVSKKSAVSKPQTPSPSPKKTTTKKKSSTPQRTTTAKKTTTTKRTPAPREVRTINDSEYKYKIELSDGLQLLLLPTPIGFPYKSATLETKYQNSVKYTVDFLVENNEYNAIIEGNSFENDTEIYNMLLSRARAYSVYREILNAGIDRDRVLLSAAGDKTLYATRHKAKEDRLIRVIVVKGKRDYERYLDYLKSFGL